MNTINSKRRSHELNIFDFKICFYFQLSLHRHQGSSHKSPQTIDCRDIIKFIDPIVGQSDENILEDSSRTRETLWETRTKGTKKLVMITLRKWLEHLKSNLSSSSGLWSPTIFNLICTLKKSGNIWWPKFSIYHTIAHNSPQLTSTIIHYFMVGKVWSEENHQELVNLFVQDMVHGHLILWGDCPLPVLCISHGHKETHALCSERECFKDLRWLEYLKLTKPTSSAIVISLFWSLQLF